MNGSSLAVVRRKLIDASDHAGAAFSAFTDRERERHVCELIDALRIAAKAAGFRLVVR